MNKGVVGLIVAILSLSVLMSCSCEAADTDIEKEIQGDLQQSEAVIEAADKKLKNGNPITTEVNELKGIANNIRTSDLLVVERFKIRAEELRTRGPKAQERHRVMEEGYRKALQEYLGIIDSLPPDGTAQQSAIDDLMILLKKILPKKKRPIFGTLPYRNLNYPATQPSQSPPIVPAYKGGNKVVSPDDTASTEEAPITEEISTLAQSLNWNPVLIYEYMKNNIDTEWYWGCMKGAEETLHQKSGNDCDQSTLFAALLRASGFPTRYVRGTIEFFAGGKNINIDKVKNLTGIDDPMKIAEFFQKAGIPYKPIIQGGKITNFQIEHVWIESRIPYGNYRGAIIDDSDPVWLGLDTSIKRTGYTYNSPTDIFQQSAVSGQLAAMRDGYLGTLQTQTPQEYLEAQLTTDGYQLPDLMKTRTLNTDIMKILPASMQFELRRITNEYTEIPDELRHKVKFTASDMNNNELFSMTMDTFKLSNQKISINYEPETVEDQETIDSYGGLDNTPAYMVRLRPILKIGGDMVVAGEDGLPMGEEHLLRIELISPNGTETVTNTQITGNVVAIGIVAGKVTPSNSPLPQEGMNVGAYGDTPSEGEKDAEQILCKEATNYIERWNKAEDELASLLHLTVTRPIPTAVTVGGVIDVTYVLDMPHGFQWKGEYIDASVRAVEVTPSRSPLAQGGDENRKKTFMQLAALQGSILENMIFEDDFRVDSISTAKLFEIANSNHTPILTIDRSNITTVMPTLPFDANIKEDISNAVNQNLKVRIPQSEITYDDWTGIGYVKENPETGEAGYMLTGMIAGGMTAVSSNKWISQGLRNVMQKPYSGNIVITPVMVNIIFPYDEATLGVSPLDVEGIVSDPIAKVDVNGTKAEVSKDGRFIARGVSLQTGTNRITATASSVLGTGSSQIINVAYQPLQTEPMKISITYPAAGASIDKPTTMVKGTVTSDAQEISLKINGMAADIYGNQFVINNVPLVDGDNVIVANAVDSNGSVARAEVSVKADTAKPYITLSINITSGIPSLTTYFLVSTATPNSIASYQMDFDGDGVVDYTGDIFENMTFTYTTEGIYYPAVTVTDDQGNSYSDSIAITVLNKTKIDTLLKGKWMSMTNSLIAKDIATALTFIASGSRSAYEQMFNALYDQLPSITETQRELNLIYIADNIAKYKLITFENNNFYSYEVTFVKDAKGAWKILQY